MVEKRRGRGKLSRNGERNRWEVEQEFGGEWI